MIVDVAFRSQVCLEGPSRFFPRYHCSGAKLQPNKKSLFDVPCQVYLSVRNGAWFVRRVWDNGLPLDLALFRRSTSYLVHLLPSRFVSSKVRQQVNSRFDHAVYGLMPSHGVLTSPAVTNDDLPSRVLCGSVQVRPGVARLTSSAVHFTDATHVDHVDAVICGTGWSKCILFHSDHN